MASRERAAPTRRRNWGLAKMASFGCRAMNAKCKNWGGATRPTQKAGQISASAPYFFGRYTYFPRRNRYIGGELPIFLSEIGRSAGDLPIFPSDLCRATGHSCCFDWSARPSGRVAGKRGLGMGKPLFRSDRRFQKARAGGFGVRSGSRSRVEKRPKAHRLSFTPVGTWPAMSAALHCGRTDMAGHIPTEGRDIRK